MSAGREEPNPHVNHIEKTIIIEGSTVPCLNAIPEITWGSFRDQREKMWGLFRGWDHFRVNLGIISGAVTLVPELYSTQSNYHY